MELPQNEITVLGNGVIFYKSWNALYNAQGELASCTPHRTSFDPTTPLEDLPEDVQPYAWLVWTPQVVEAFQAQQDRLSAIDTPVINV